METRQSDYLTLASGALSRGDYLTALQFGLWAAGTSGQELQTRCDAYLVLAITSLELGAPEDALGYAVGAHLMACQAEDEPREGQAAALVAVIVAHYPHLGEPIDAQTH
ncbi:MAG TPA: hypothetical protein VK464_12690 [Symbiobacteriaceae bacterium]|nr:hypothetical protein [Symbiobacteriaceae bacterium]